MGYVIECRVSGGVTGTRTALLKRAGSIRYFDTKAEADREAEVLNFTMNGPRARASFCYRVLEAC